MNGSCTKLFEEDLSFTFSLQGNSLNSCIVLDDFVHIFSLPCLPYPGTVTKGNGKGQKLTHFSGTIESVYSLF